MLPTDRTATRPTPDTPDPLPAPSRPRAPAEAGSGVRVHDDDTMLWALVQAVDAAHAHAASSDPGDRGNGGGSDSGDRGNGGGSDPGDRGNGGGSDSGDGLLLRVIATAGAELAVLPLGGDHPLDWLLGLVAPPEWRALGVATAGRGHALDGSRPPEPVRFTMLLARSGASAGTLRRGRRATRLGEPPEGAVADACRRALGLATAPPPETTAELWARWWLDRLVQATVERPPHAAVPGWADAVALHPATFLARPGSRAPGEALLPSAPTSAPTAPAPEPMALGTAAQALTDAWTWPRLRAAPGVVEGRDPVLDPPLALWMDDGMFARWLLSSFPPLDDLLDACRSVLPEALADRVTVATTVGLGLDHRGAR